MKIAFPTLKFGVYPKRPGELLELPQFEQLLQWGKRCGFDGVELENSAFGLTDMSNAKLLEMRRLLDQYDLEAVSIKEGGDLTTENAAHHENLMKEAVRVAGILGADIISVSLGQDLSAKGVSNQERLGGHFYFGGSHWASDHDMRQTADSLRRICETAELSGVQVSLEIRTTSIADNSKSILKLYHMVNHPAFGLNPDVANVVWAYHDPDESWYECLEAMAPYTNYLHVKNITALPIPELNRTIFKRGLLSDGLIDFRHLLSHMKALGYSGYVVLEGADAGDKFFFFEQDIRYLRQLSKEIEF